MDKFNTIGGTTISGILGVSPWLSPLGAYLKLRGEVTDGGTNDAIERGVRFEDVVAQTFQATHAEFKVVHNDEFTDTPQRVVDKDCEYFTGSPDRLLYASDAKVGDNIVAGLEIKTASMRNRSKWGAPGTDQIPINYMCQVQWYLGFYPNITNWHVAVEFFDDNEKPLLYAEYLVKRDDELIANMRKAGKDFWERHVLTGDAPEYEMVDAVVPEYVKKTYGDDLGTTLEATTEENALVAQYLQAKKEKESAEEKYETLKTRLQLVIKDNSCFQTDYGKITWKKSKARDVIDYKALVEFLHPKYEVIQKFTTVKEGSRLFNDRGLRFNDGK